MSATGRGGDRVSEDFYPTPTWCTRRILEALEHYKDFCRGTERAGALSWLEPCAGDGAIVSEAHRWNPEIRINGSDIRELPRPPGCTGVWAGGRDFRWWSENTFGAVITNPPFSLAPELIAHFLPRCDWLILLLRSSFKLCAGEPGREGYRNYRDNMPDEYKLPQRPEFVASLSCRERLPNGKTIPGCGWRETIAINAQRPKVCPNCSPVSGVRFVQCSTTDASEYSWFVWTPERNRSAGLTRILPDTPLGERRADR